MISLSTSQAVKLRTLFESLVPLLSEGTLVFSKEGMRVKGSSIQAYASVFIDGNSEIEYVYDSKESCVEVGISFATLHSCLTAIGPSDSVRFILTEEAMIEARPYIIVQVENFELSYRYETKIYQLLIENTTVDEPPNEFSQKVSIPSTLFLKILRFSQRRGEAVQIYTQVEEKKLSLVFRTKGDEADLIFCKELKTLGDEEPVFVPKMELYSLRFLLLISKATNLSSHVEIFLEDKQILAIKYSIGTIGTVLFALAPQVEEATECPRAMVPSPKETKPETKIQTSKLKRPVKKRKKRAQSVIVN